MIITSFFLSKDHEGKLTTLQLIGMVRGVASGMLYLSAMNFIHRVSISKDINKVEVNKITTIKLKIIVDFLARSFGSVIYCNCVMQVVLVFASGTVNDTAYSVM